MADEPAISFDDDLNEGDLPGTADTPDSETPKPAESGGDKPDDASDKGDDKADPLDALLDGDQADPLAELGITTETAPELTKKAQAFDVFTGLIETNQRLLLDEIEKKFPTEYQKLITEASDRFVAMHEGKDGNEGGESKAGKTAPEVAKLERSIASLAARLDQNDSKEQQASEEVRTQGLRTAFEGRMKSLLDHPVLKDVPARDKKAIAALTRESLSNDSTARENVSKGNFQDLAVHLKSVVSDWAKDFTNANKQEHTDRKGVKDRGESPVHSGPHPAAGEVESADENWDLTVNSFADSLLKSQKRK